MAIFITIFITSLCWIGILTYLMQKEKRSRQDLESQIADLQHENYMLRCFMES